MPQGMDVTGDLRRMCPALTLQQMYRLTEYHHDEWISGGQSGDTIHLLEAIKRIVDGPNGGVSPPLSPSAQPGAWALTAELLRCPLLKHVMICREAQGRAPLAPPTAGKGTTTARPLRHPCVPGTKRRLCCSTHRFAWLSSPKNALSACCSAPEHFGTRSWAVPVTE